MMSSDEREAVLAALEVWAKQSPNEPVAGFLQSERLKTPNELVEAVRRESSDGQAVLQILEHGIRRFGLKLVVTRLGTPPSRGGRTRG
jgi:hypothetical protein